MSACERPQRLCRRASWLPMRTPPRAATAHPVDDHVVSYLRLHLATLYRPDLRDEIEERLGGLDRTLAWQRGCREGRQRVSPSARDNQP